MKRPADQAKLLLFYLLRSSAALATETPKFEGHICLRLARRTDVPSLQRCNLATLPENYNSQFYVSHLRQWPDLALVAEHVSPQTKNRFNSAFRPPEPNIVGYVLGKVETTSQQRSFSIPGNHLLTPEERAELYHASQSPEILGHVTSLAVLQEYRRQGLAAALMNQLHFHLSQVHNAPSVGLHVRKSNLAAAKLYQSDGYVVENVIQNYYQDGEDAYFMKKELLNEMESVGNKQKKWKQNGPFRLPRELRFRETEENMATEQPQIITGTL